MQKEKINEMIKCLIDNGYSLEDIISFRGSRRKTVDQLLKEGLSTEEYESALKGKLGTWDEEVDFLSDAIACYIHWASMPEGFLYLNLKHENLIKTCK